MYEARSLRAALSARVVSSCACVADASRAARDVRARDVIVMRRLRLVQLGEHVVVDRGHVLEAVELTERVVERPGAEDDLQRARVAVVEEEPHARGEPPLRDACTAHRDLHLGREHHLIAAQRRPPHGAVAPSRGLRLLEPCVQGIEREQSRALLRDERGVLRLQRRARRSGPRRPGPADRRKDENAGSRDGNAKRPPPRRMCLPKHGENPTRLPEKARRAACSCPGSPCPLRPLLRVAS